MDLNGRLVVGSATTPNLSSSWICRGPIYSNLYYLNIKIFIKGAFSDEYEERELKMHKRLVKTDGGHLFRREPKEFSPALNLENDLIENDRSDILSKLFTDFLVPFSDRASTRES